MFIQSYNNSFTIGNMAGEFVNPENMIVSSNYSSSIINATFHSSPYLILTLLYFYLESNLVKTFFISIFLMIAEINGNR